MRILFIIILISLYKSAISETYGNVTGYKIPRFVSLKSDNVNLRVGPSINYPIKIKYIQENLPVEVIDEYDVWRQIKDIEGSLGWIHQSLLKGDRYVIIKSISNKETNLFNIPDGNIIGFIGNRNIVKLKKCSINWCLINYNDFNGWIKKSNLWGVYPNEKYKINFFQPLINFYWKCLLISKELIIKYYK